MIRLYDPATGAFTSTAGQQKVSPEILLLNILIELRVANAIFMDSQRGLVTETPQQYRSDIINET